MILLLISKAPSRKQKRRAKPFLIAGWLALKLEKIAGWMSKTTTASGAGENLSGVLVLFPMLERNFLQFHRSQNEVIRICATRDAAQQRQLSCGKKPQDGRLALS
jgi:hypothetical protein